MEGMENGEPEIHYLSKNLSFYYAGLLNCSIMLFNF